MHAPHPVSAPVGHSSAPALSSFQLQLAQDAAQYLQEHLHRHVTIAELCRQFSVSPTHLKQAFKGVFQLPVYTYAKQQKMYAAARRLRTEHCSVSEVAAAYGYDNPSKFAAAFRQVMGVTPKAYQQTSFHPDHPSE